MSASPADHAAERVGNTTAIRVHGNDRDPLVVVSGVNKHYGDLHVLNDINTTVGRGEVVVVLGPSGSGKSTLCRAINRLETIDSGTITIDGLALPWDCPDAQREATLRAIRRNVGMVFQQFHLFPHRTVLQNVTEAPIHVLRRRRDEVEAAWQWVDPILKAWDDVGQQPQSYTAGTWGPSQAIALIERDGRTWHEVI